MAAAIAHRNLPVVREHISVAFGNTSIVVKIVAVSVVLGYFCSFSESIMMATTVIPGYVLPPNFWAWTYFTHWFIETHIWDVIIDIIVLMVCGKILEPLWGALDMFIFFFVVNFGVAVVTSFVYLFLYFVTKDYVYLFETRIHGLAGNIAGFSVALKQSMPDNVIATSPLGKLRNTHIPLMLLCTAILMRIAGVFDGTYPIMFGVGMFVGWIYLRFYQKHSNGNYGDMADNFTFASFFPSRLQPIVGIISNTLFIALVKLKICKKPQRKYDVSSPHTVTISLPGTDPQDAERRRTLALKALNERLSKAEQAPKWPSMVDEEGNKSPKTPPSDKKTSSQPESQKSVKLPVPAFKESSETKSTESDS